MRELDTAGRLGAQTTFFRLGEDPGLARFIDSMARRVDGRVVAPELDDLGAAVVGSYLGSRSPATPFGSYRDMFGTPRVLGRLAAVPDCSTRTAPPIPPTGSRCLPAARRARDEHRDRTTTCRWVRFRWTTTRATMHRSGSEKHAALPPA